MFPNGPLRHVLHHDGHPDSVHLIQREEHLPGGPAERSSWDGSGSHLAALLLPQTVSQSQSLPSMHSCATSCASVMFSSDGLLCLSGSMISTLSEFPSVTESRRAGGKQSSPSPCRCSSTRTGRWWWTSLKSLFLNSTTRWPQRRRPINAENIHQCISLFDTEGWFWSIRVIFFFPHSSLLSASF